jgi:hypothetical protein
MTNMNAGVRQFNWIFCQLKQRVIDVNITVYHKAEYIESRKLKHTEDYLTAKRQRKLDHLKL